MKTISNIKYQISNTKGQALVSLLFISLIGFTIITVAAILVYLNSQSASVVEQGEYAYYVAESGAEEGLLRLLRNPQYAGTPAGEPLLVSSGSAEIRVNNGIITSTGTYKNATRKIQVVTVYNNGVLSINSWKEVR